MTKTQLLGDFLYGYVSGEERVYIENSAEQIAAFIMKNRFNHQVRITNYLNILELQTMGEFIDRCENKAFLNDELMPVLLPMELGEIEVPEFVPYVDEAYSLKNIRVVNENGKHVLIDIEFSECMEETLVNDEEFNTEEELIAKYPHSVSEKLAGHIVNATPYKRDEFIEEYAYFSCSEEDAKDLLMISDEEFEKLWVPGEEKLTAFVDAVAKRVEGMTFEELLDFTFKHDLYIRSTN